MRNLCLNITKENKEVIQNNSSEIEKEDRHPNCYFIDLGKGNKLCFTKFDEGYNHFSIETTQDEGTREIVENIVQGKPYFGVMFEFGPNFRPLGEERLSTWRDMLQHPRKYKIPSGELCFENLASKYTRVSSVTNAFDNMNVFDLRQIPVLQDLDNRLSLILACLTPC